MKSFLHYLHGQVMGSLRAGKEWKDAETAVGKGASKLFAFALGLVAIAVAVIPMFLDFLPPRIALRALLLSILILGMAFRFWRGVSVFSMLGGLLRYWIPTAFMIYAYFTGGKMAIVLFKENGSPDYAFHGGIMMMIMAFLGVVTSWIQANVVAEAAAIAGTTDRIKIVALRFYALIWVGFFFGGAFMLAWATGLADWFFVDVLGW
jgi:hypothetical protein